MTIDVTVNVFCKIESKNSISPHTQTTHKLTPTERENTHTHRHTFIYTMPCCENWSGIPYKNKLYENTNTKNESKVCGCMSNIFWEIKLLQKGILI